MVLLLTQAYFIISLAHLSRGGELKSILKLGIGVSASGLYYALAVSASIIA